MGRDVIYSLISELSFVYYIDIKYLLLLFAVDVDDAAKCDITVLVD